MSWQGMADSLPAFPFLIMREALERDIVQNPKHHILEWTVSKISMHGRISTHGNIISLPLPSYSSTKWLPYTVPGGLWNGSWSFFCKQKDTMCIHPGLFKWGNGIYNYMPVSTLPQMEIEYPPPDNIWKCSTYLQYNWDRFSTYISTFMIMPTVYVHMLFISYRSHS